MLHVILIIAHHDHVIGHITLPVVKCKDHVIRDNDYVMIPEMAITMAIPSQQVYHDHVMLMNISCLQWISKYGREATKVQLDNYMVTSNNLITGRKVFHLANKKVTSKISLKVLNSYQ